MRLTSDMILRLAGVAAASGLLAACGDDGGNGSDPTPDTVETPDTAEDTQLPGPDDTTDPGDAPDAPPTDAGDTGPTPDGNDDATDPGDVSTDVPVDVEPERSCTTNADCNDGLACTTDVCTDAGICAWTLNSGSCFIGGRCFAANATNPASACQACQPAANTFSWTTLSDGAPCDAGDLCVVNATCAAGVCEGESLACEDGNDCTENACDPSLGCVFTPLADGVACDDGNACTLDDVCLAGTCSPGENPCDDGNPCTTNGCVAETGECTSEFNTNPCETGNACTVNDVCSEGECIAGGPRNCNDGNSCTIDLCDEFVGCVHLPDRNPCCEGEVSVCDDGDVCTTDLCDPETASCAYEFNDALCNDGNACTINDTCSEGDCSGTPRNCDDGNPCTINTCDPIAGCRTVNNDGAACDDGIACTLDDVCQAGRCVAGINECVCEPTFSSATVILTRLAIGANGRSGNGLNVDGNVNTCAPAGQCDSGIDNALSSLAALVNEPLGDAVADGSLALLVELESLVLNPFTMAVYTGDPVDETCDVSTTRCDFVVSASTVNPETCSPEIALPATRAGTRVTAGGPGTIFPFEIPFGDSVLTLTIFNVRFDGQIVVSGNNLTSLQGILAGAVPKQSLIDAINALPDDSLPFPKATVIQILNLVVRNDVDSNGDGTLDAASIGILLEGTSARIAGIDR